MKDILNKISSYNIFNYLFPGVLFISFSSKLTHYSYINQDIVKGLFFYYFIGLVISRFGSIIIEPLLKKFSFIKFANYSSYIAVEKNDEKLELLSEVNNTYRTLCSLFILLILLKLYESIEIMFPSLKNWNSIIALVSLLILFLFSYKKQSKYIEKRVNANKK